jgi:proline racemase
MCGHDTIGLCTALIETGMIKPVEPCTLITLDIPAGLVKVSARVKNGVVKEVTFRNIPSFVFRQDADIEVPGLGTITMDIAYGGNYYAILRAEDVGLRIRPEYTGDIVRVANLIRDAVNSQVKVFHPEKDFIHQVTHVEFSAPPTDPGAHLKNAVVIPNGSIDRSPCGTGSSAKLAVLYAKGMLHLDQEFIHQSIIGSLFRCRVTAETKVGGLPAVIPEVTGSAYITGMHTFVIDPDDPLPEGFKLS